MGSLKDLWGHHVVLSRASFSNFWRQFAKSHTVIRAIWYTITLLMLIPIHQVAFQQLFEKPSRNLDCFVTKPSGLIPFNVRFRHHARQGWGELAGGLPWWHLLLNVSQSWVGILPWMWFWFIIHVCRQLDTYLRNVYFYTHMVNGTVKMISQPCAD